MALRSVWGKSVIDECRSKTATDRHDTVSFEHRRAGFDLDYVRL
jgi:hypothetical protein